MTETPVTESTMTDSTGSRRSRSRGFHRLAVKRVEPLTGDSAAITLTVPDDLAGVFAFAAGQTLTVRRGEERRSYSICTSLPASTEDCGLCRVCGARQ